MNGAWFRSLASAGLVAVVVACDSGPSTELGEVEEARTIHGWVLTDADVPVIVLDGEVVSDAEADSLLASARLVEVLRGEQARSRVAGAGEREVLVYESTTDDPGGRGALGWSQMR